MSTYTDLHNRVKENITVDYNSRITPQEVHLLNENNEFWGTLKGHISAENINIDGGTLKNVKLENIELCGSVVLPGDIDIGKITKSISELSTNLQSVKSDNDEKHIKYDDSIDDINDDISKHYEDIKTLSNSLKDIDNRKRPRIISI